MRLLALVGAVLLLALAGSAQSAQRTRGAVTVPGTITALAADGRLVAAHVATPRSCDRVLLWTGSGKATSIAAGCENAQVTDLALAGTRVLWVNYDYGNHAYCHLYTASVAHPGRVELDFC